MEKKPELAMRVAVRGMMPRNVITKDSLKRLHVYAGDTHEQPAPDGSNDVHLALISGSHQGLTNDHLPRRPSTRT